MVISTMIREEIVVVDSGEAGFYTTISAFPDVEQVKILQLRQFEKRLFMSIHITAVRDLEIK